jgi:hypothetical protein
MACYPCRFSCLLIRLIGLLLLTPVFFLLGGAWGTYEALFGDISVTQNTTLAAQRAAQLVYEAYQTGHTPSAFIKWGVAIAALYVVTCVIYILIKFSCICHECSKAIDESDNDSKAAVAELRKGHMHSANAHELSSMEHHQQLLRATYAQANQDSNSSSYV